MSFSLTESLYVLNNCALELYDRVLNVKIACLGSLMSEQSAVRIASSADIHVIWHVARYAFVLIDFMFTEAVITNRRSLKP
jgi:hypothetical protein